jgi:hypothetical protein
VSDAPEPDARRPQHQRRSARPADGGAGSLATRTRGRREEPPRSGLDAQDVVARVAGPVPAAEPLRANCPVSRVLTMHHSQVNSRGRHRVSMEPYGYLWYRLGGLTYLLDRAND